MTSTDIIARLKKQKEKLEIDLSLQKDSQNFTELFIRAFLDKGTNLESSLDQLALLFIGISTKVCSDNTEKCKEKWEQLLTRLPQLLEVTQKDADAFFQSDPASQSKEEIVLSYPGFYALVVYRLAHEIYNIGFPLLPRLMTEFAHGKTGVDIHPGAKIGHSIFIDHATGVVIGETTEMGNNIRIYQGVTLGALYVKKDLRAIKRHPTIEDNVTIYANATILGGNTVIGKNSTIGANTWITSSVGPNSKVYYTSKEQTIL